MKPVKTGSDHCGLETAQKSSVNNLILGSKPCSKGRKTWLVQVSTLHKNEAWREYDCKKFQGWSRNLTTYIDCLSYHSPGKTGLTQHGIVGSDLRPCSVLAWRRFTPVWRAISLQGSSCCCTVVAFLPALKDLLRTKQQSFSFVKSFLFCS